MTTELFPWWTVYWEFNKHNLTESMQLFNKIDGSLILQKV